MGLSATIGRMMFLQARKDDIGLQLSMLANTKTILASNMDKVSRKYQEALTQKSFKWTNNGGATYTDIRYSNLMQPSVENQNIPLLLTDKHDRIVVDEKYRKYAELISANGNSGGDWESVRTQVLSELTGIAMIDNNPTLTAEEKGLINFYDTLFSSIAEKGWTYNEQVIEPEYLNQVLQNNLYTITTVKSNKEYNEYSETFSWDNEYETDTASSFKNFIKVNDDCAKETAYAEYQHEKSKINAKESNIDLRMKNLETEQAAINQMIESYQKISQENIDRTLNLFG